MKDSCDQLLKRSDYSEETREDYIFKKDREIRKSLLQMYNEVL